jgi:1-acyl-sn-glycerol-3-phosphate acyltransferase
MLEAKKNFLFEKIFIVYNRSLLKRYFHSIKVSGLNSLENRITNLPLIIYANHSSWWDGLIVLEVLSNFNFDNYVMMEEKQLRKLRFFRRIGAFSVVRTNRREAVESIEYSVKILSEKTNRTLLIFPQGEILHNDIRPLRFYNGLAKIIEQSGNCLVCPLIIRYEFLGQFKPEIFITIGEPRVFNSVDKIVRKKVTKEFEEVLTTYLDKLKSNLINNDLDNFKKIL